MIECTHKAQSVTARAMKNSLCFSLSIFTYTHLYNFFLWIRREIHSVIIYNSVFYKYISVQMDKC